MRDFTFFSPRFFSPRKSPSAADRAVAVLIGAVQSLDSFAERGRPFGKPMRELIVPFGRSSYVLRYAYRKDAEEVVVARIWHSREARE